MFVTMNWVLVEPTARDHRAEIHRRVLELSMSADRDRQTHHVAGGSVAHVRLPAPRNGGVAPRADHMLLDA